MPSRAGLKPIPPIPQNRAPRLRCLKKNFFYSHWQWSTLPWSSAAPLPWPERWSEHGKPRGPAFLPGAPDRARRPRGPTTPAKAPSPATPAGALQAPRPRSPGWSPVAPLSWPAIPSATKDWERRPVSTSPRNRAPHLLKPALVLSTPEKQDLGLKALVIFNTP